jgi:predicted RNA-binding Zn-ribbon protein involved in translation (DUF1610 family)
MSAARVELIPMLCVRCQQPVPAQPDQVVWACPHCGQGMLLSDAEGLAPLAIHYAAGIAPNAHGKPVWVAVGQVSPHRETFSGDDNRAMEEFWAQPRAFYIPAYALPLNELIDGGVRLLRQPLPLQEAAPAGPPADSAAGRPPPNAMLPVTLRPEDIYPLAEYIVLAVEAERRDQLKYLTFALQLGAPELWVFP